MGYGNGYGYEHHMMGSGNPAEAILTIIIAAAVIAVLLRMLRRGGSGMRFGRCDSALHVLEERYAKGEVDTQEFEDRRKHLLGMHGK